MMRSAGSLIVASALALAACRSHDAAPVASAPSPTTVPPVPRVLAERPAPPAREAPVVVETAAPSPGDPDCLASSAPAPKPTEIHRWVDAAGVTHYSDRPPALKVRDDRIVAVVGAPPIAVHASGYDVNLPDDVERRAVVDALGVQRVLHDALGVASPAGASLDIVFVRDAGIYASRVADPKLASSAGAYVPAQHTIYVRMQADDETSFAVLRHEITHALVHESVGYLAVPINEGLAEYFRRYRAAGMGGQIDVGDDRDALMQAAPAAGADDDALVDLLAEDGSTFYRAAERDRRYLRAYALVAALMEDGAGTAALHALLARQRGISCETVAPEAVFGTAYPDGLAGLAAAWGRFMRSPPNAVRAY